MTQLGKRNLSVWLLCLGAMSCSKTTVLRTSLAVTVESEFAVGTEVNRIEATYANVRGTSAPQILDLLAPQTFPVTFRPVSSPGADGEEMRVTVTAFLDNVAVVSQKVTTFLIKDKHAFLTVRLNRSCASAVIACNETQTCLDGTCGAIPRRAATVIVEADGGSSDDALSGPTVADGGAKAECVSDSDCTSNHCADGVCCDVACTGKCQACNLPGSLRVCKPVPENAADPRKICQDKGQCDTTGLCDGRGGCAFYGVATLCGGPQTCVEGVHTPQRNCNGAGACSPAVPSPCPTGLACKDGTCTGSCTVDADCGNSIDFYCDRDMCKQKIGKGMRCVTGNSCATGFCVDGVCCGNATCGVCQACNVNGMGTCSAVPSGNMDPRGLCLNQGPANACGTTGFCDGDSACAYYPSTTACGAGASCSAAMYTAASQCDGRGACVSVASVACPKGLGCLSATECRGSCRADGDCVSSSMYCSAGQCVPKLGNGAICAAGGCASGNCVNKICCSEACVDQGAASCGQTGVCGAGGTCQKYTCTCDGFAMPNPASAVGLPNPTSYSSTAGSGFVVDNVTNLAWEQPIGSASMDQVAALKYCADKGGGWRLPTMVELYSLVDFTRSDPAIDIAAFPNTPSSYFWTSTAVTGDPSRAWGIYFFYGSASTSTVSSTVQVRCVRSML